MNPSAFYAGAAVGGALGLALYKLAEPMPGTSLGLGQRVKLRLDGRVFLRREGPPRFKGPTVIWGFLCPEHGLVEDYLHGYYERMECHRCDYSVEFIGRL